MIATDNSPITPVTVKAALQGLIYAAQAQRPNPLETLAVIDQSLAESYGTYQRSFALSCLLTTLIHDELVRHRQALNIPITEQELSITEARDSIIADAESGCVELIGWSWLYYRFVRVEFNISPPVFSEMVCINARTLYRYQDHIIRRLTQQLIELEQRARAEEE